VTASLWEHLKGLIPEEEAKIYGHCAYCGRPCYGPACSEHIDLVRAERAEVR
jgi:hypothetical protein